MTVTSWQTTTSSSGASCGPPCTNAMRSTHATSRPGRPLVAHRRRRAPEVVRCREVRCRPGSRKRHCGRTVLPVPRGHDLHRAGAAADGHAVGQVLPVRACRLVKGSVDGEVAEIDVDDTGFFRFPVSDREKFRLHLEADGQAHVTQWVTV